MRIISSPPPPPPRVVTGGQHTKAYRSPSQFAHPFRTRAEEEEATQKKKEEMRAAVAVVASRGAAAAPSFRSLKPIVRCSSASPSAAVSTIIPVSTSFDHISFIKDVAATRPPEHLNHLLNMLQAQGETIISPGAKEGMIPIVIPISESSTGTLTSLLRWPTAPPGLEMPVVEVHKHGVCLLAKSVKPCLLLDLNSSKVDQYIQRILVEEDANSQDSNHKLWDASAEVGEKLYKKGNFFKSGIADLDAYLLRKIGLFPDVIERKVSWHLEKGDQVSAMIAGEFYTKKHFPGFGRPFAFNAQLLLKVGRNLEAKDAARGSLKSPWWTLGFKYQEVAEIAEWEDEQIEYIKEKVTEEGKQEDLRKGKAPEQVVLDEAAFLLDLASVDGTWDEVVDRVAECYKEAGLYDIERFILFKE